MTLESEYRTNNKRETLSLNGHPIYLENVTGSKLLKCVTLGPAASFSEQAAAELLQDQTTHDFVKTNRAIIEVVKEKRFDMGVVASENSIEGNVVEIYKALIHSDLTILGELALNIHQTLYGTPAAWEKRKINSHPQGFAQCGKWINTNLPDAEIVTHDSTSYAVQYAAEHDELAIGSPIAGEKYKIPTIKSEIEDRRGNTTRFWLVGRGETEPTGNDRTKIIVSLRNAPGTLKKVIDPFADRSISINKIDTIPLTLDHYYFLISIDGHIKDDPVAEALAEAQKYCWRLKHIGSFQKSMLPEIEYEPEAFEKGWVPESENTHKSKIDSKLN